MTISTTTIKNSYSGNGSTTTFNYTFKITDQDDIDVIIRSSTGVETTKTITTHYTVTGVGNANGGTVVFTSGNIPSGTETVVLRRSTPQTQGVDLIENDPQCTRCTVNLSNGPRKDVPGISTTESFYKKKFQVFR